MTIDHIGFFLLNESTDIYLAFRTIGRIAFPIFAFLIVEGYFHTSNKWKYFQRLAMLAIIFEVALLIIYFIYGTNLTHFAFLNQQTSKMNIMWTLMLGFIGLHLVDRYKKRGLIFLIPLGFISYFLSYSFYGFGLILIFGMFKTFNQKLIYGTILTFIYCLLPAFKHGINYINWIQFLSIFSFYLIYYYNGLKGNHKMRFFYYYYPLHIFVLFLIRHYLF